MATVNMHPHARYHHHVTKPPEGVDRWICFYPAYISKDKTSAEGRRIPKSKAVSGPTCKEVAEVLSTTGLQIYIENKIYCREQSKEPINWGRVRVQIQNEGVPINPKFKTRESLFVYVAEKIPNLKSRTNPKTAPASQGAQQQPGKQGKGKKKK